MSHEHKLCSGSQTIKQSFVLVHCVHSLSTHNILLWICEVQYTIRRRRYTTGSLCELLVGDGVKRRPRNIIR
jgi:hypothetical protein